VALSLLPTLAFRARRAEWICCSHRAKRSGTDSVQVGEVIDFQGQGRSGRAAGTLTVIGPVQSHCVQTKARNCQETHDTILSKHSSADTIYIVILTILQCIQKVFRPLDFLHILLCYSLILKLIQLFSLLNLHTIPHNDKEKQFRHFLQMY
jgi:hypothetical protein